MEDIFERILLDKPKELEYLKLLMESDFLKKLADELTTGSYFPRHISIEVSYVDKSPRLQPISNWPLDYGGVEFGDILFTLKKEVLIREQGTGPIKATKSNNSSTAFIFQTKINSNESGKSTKKQEKLYREWPEFNIHSPYQIRDVCNNPSDLFEKSDSEGRSVKKSGVWIIHSRNYPMPEIIVRDSADSSKDLSFDLKDFFKEFEKHNCKHIPGKYFYEGNGDDWSKLITAILNYTRKKKLRRFSSACNRYKSICVKKSMEFSFLPKKYSEFDSKKFGNISLFERIKNFLFPSHPLMVVEIEITEVEFRN